GPVLGCASTTGRRAAGDHAVGRRVPAAGGHNRGRKRAAALLRAALHRAAPGRGHAHRHPLLAHPQGRRHQRPPVTPFSGGIHAVTLVRPTSIPNTMHTITTLAALDGIKDLINRISVPEISLPLFTLLFILMLVF